MFETLKTHGVEVTYKYNDQGGVDMIGTWQGDKYKVASVKLDLATNTVNAYDTDGVLITSFSYADRSKMQKWLQIQVTKFALSCNTGLADTYSRL